MRLFARKSGTVGDPRLAQGPTAVIIAHYRVAMVNRPPPPRIVPRRQFSAPWRRWSTFRSLYPL